MSLSGCINILTKGMTAPMPKMEEIDPKNKTTKKITNLFFSLGVKMAKK